MPRLLSCSVVLCCVVLRCAPQVELGVIMIGPGFNILVFGMFILTAWVFNNTLGHFPEIMCVEVVPGVVSHRG